MTSWVSVVLTAATRIPHPAPRAWTRNGRQQWAPTGLCVLAALVVAGSPMQAQERVVRAYFDDPLIAAKAVISLEALESDYEKGYIVVRGTEDDLDALRRAGMRVVGDGPRSATALRTADTPASPSGTIPGYACYRTVERTYADAAAIVERHPSLATWSVVGKSWKKVQNASEGYDLKVLRLTNSAISGTKPVLFLTTAVHAREYVTAEFGTRFAERLVDAYETDADVRWLLDHQEVHIMLHANPDGRKRAEAGLLWRKNHNTSHCPDLWPGVDLNRNFDFKFGRRAAPVTSGARRSTGARRPLPSRRRRPSRITWTLCSRTPGGRRTTTRRPPTRAASSWTSTATAASSCGPGATSTKPPRTGRRSRRSAASWRSSTATRQCGWSASIRPAAPPDDGRQRGHDGCAVRDVRRHALQQEQRDGVVPEHRCSSGRAAGGGPGSQEGRMIWSALIQR